MCGLHGMLTVKAERNADDFLFSAYVAGSLRGKDSSGIAIVDLAKSEYEVHKLPVNGTFFAAERVASRLIREASRAATLAICHTRHATIGGISIDTSHPFECYDGDERALVGAHNGTLTNWKHKKGASLYEVDSEWALNHILTEKFDAFEDFTGAYCFTWWDTDNPEVFNIARNKDRPMFVAMLKTGGMAYASEAGMLYWLLERHEIDMAGPILELAEDHWYKFPCADPASFTKTALPKPKYGVVSTTPNYHGHSARTPWKSEVDKVQELLDRVAASSAAKVSTPAGTGGPLALPFPVPKSPLVSEEEHKAAAELGLIGSRATFVPVQMWGDTVDGMSEILGGDNEAEVRGWKGESIDNDDSLWHCAVIGAVDDGSNIKIILGSPGMREILKPETVH